MPKVVFILGCGRSGTTILGQLLSMHPKVTYLNEPIDIWNAIDPKTDCLDFFGGKGICHMDESDVNEINLMRARRVFSNISLVCQRTLVVEKLPSNCWRLRWLRQLFPNSQFIHLVRNGQNVVSSITRLSHDRSYRVGGRTEMSKWWGVGNHKLRQLIQEAPLLVGYSSELKRLPAISEHYYQILAAHEWISANWDVEQSKERLGLSDLDYLLVRYEDLIRDPRGKLQDLNRWMGLADPGAQFYETAKGLVRYGGDAEDCGALADWILEDFTSTMRRYGYGPADGRAACSRVARAAGRRR